MATATSASNASSTAAFSGQGAEDNYASSSSADRGADAQGGDNLPSDPASTGQQPAAAATPPADPAGDDGRSADPLKTERRKNNQLNKEIRTLRQQLNRFTEINLEEYSHLQEAERQKQVLEERMELRERQMEEASARKVAAVASERDEAKQQVLQLRKDRLLELAFSQAMAAAVIRGSAARSPRLWARAARSSLSSRPMLAAITAMFSRPSGLVGSMGAFCKGATGRLIPEIIQALISRSFLMDPAETVFREPIS